MVYRQNDVSGKRQCRKATRKLSKRATTMLAILILFFVLVQAGGGNDKASANYDVNLSSDSKNPLSGGHTSSMRFTLSTGAHDFALSGGEDLEVIQPEGFSMILSPGNPMLPHKDYNILVLPDTLESSLELRIISAETRVLDGLYDIKPAAPYVTWADGRWIEAWGEGKEIVNGRNMNIYGTNASYPEDYVKLLPSSQMRKWKFIKVDFTPYQYNPVTQKLTQIESVVIEISYERSGAVPEVNLLKDEVMDDIASKIFLNYEEAKEWYTYEGGLYIPSSDIYDYVIITTNSIESNSSKLSSFVSHKQNHGHSVLVITEDEFWSLTGRAPNHKAEKIRKWLINNYASKGIEYVLLIGDPHPYESGEGDIPMKMCWPRAQGHNEAPTDFFYADLTGNWDYDADQDYGEFSDDYGPSGGVDFTPEVYVGRIPVYGADYTTLDNILQKIIDYEDEGGSLTWRKNTLLPMGFQYPTGPYDGARLGEQMKNDYLDPHYFSSWRMYQQGNGACSLDSSYTSEEELRGGTVVRDRWAADDYGIVCWWGHGSQIHTIVGYSGCNDGNLFHNSYCSSLDDDHPSFTYQCSCNNGWPEDINNLQYAILKRGGIGTVSATRVSWFSYTQTQFDNSTTNSGIGYEYVKRLVANKPAGQALYLTKQNVNPMYNETLMNWYGFNLYGDPSTKLLGMPTITSCNSSGTEINSFTPNESVYARGSGLEATTQYRIWLQDNPLSSGEDINVSEDPSTVKGDLVTTDINGSFGPTAIWAIPEGAPVAHHEYDIVVDKQNDGEHTDKFNSASDGIDSVSAAGIVAPVPELSTIILFGVGLLALVGYIQLRRKNRGVS